MSESEAATLRDTLHPLVLSHRLRFVCQLACFCLLCQGLLFLLAKALAEAIGLSDKFKNVSLAREPI